MMTEPEWELLRWEVRSINDHGCSIMAALGGGDEEVRFLPLGLSSLSQETLPDGCRNPRGPPPSTSGTT